MKNILSSINNPGDLKKLPPDKLDALAEEIRSFLVENVSNTGGHLASNLGVVELTIALHRAFDFSKDRLVWDVGHQSYVHKILTGRRGQFSTLRCYKGLSGFPKTEESIYDSFNTGHSSTSVSAALGMATARDLSGEDYNVVAVIGDGSMTGGMAYEALNHAGHTKTKLIVILNDNEMSIGKNVGSLAAYLNRLRTKNSYFRIKTKTEKILSSIPFAGKHIVSGVRHFKTAVKHVFIQGRFFGALGFNYIGPIDGSDIAAMTDVFNNVKNMNEPVLLHIYTKKGKGYAYAEAEPDKFHGIGNFCIETGEPINNGCVISMSDTFGRHLIKKADSNKKITAITAAMPQGTGLTAFSKAHPDRFFDVGIAEQHAVTFAAGQAIKGYAPVVAIYSTFLQRAYDQLLHDVCLQNLHVVLCLDRAGISGSDGETHHGIFDLSYLTHMPNMAVLAPSSPEMLCEMLDYAIDEHKGPIAIRYPKSMSASKAAPFVFGKAEIVREGSSVTLAAVGDMLSAAKEAAMLTEGKASVEIIDIRTVKPLDIKTLQMSADKTGRVIVLENNTVSGVGKMIKAALTGCRVECMGFPEDKIVRHGDNKALFKEFSLDPVSIARRITDISEK